jgi:hypothetical protein
VEGGHRRGTTPKGEYREEHFEPSPRRPRKHRGLLWTVIGIVVVCAIIGLLLSTLFAGADITVYPREAAVVPRETIEANINPAAGGLPYTSMTVTRAATTSVSASGTREVTRPAVGVITIYNAHSTEPQRLITNTRFEAPDGKIYRIHEPVTVPGATKGAEDTLTPGTISVTAYADSPGVEYNRGETRFSIPGFTGDPRFENFWATAPQLSGGFVGTEAAVSESDLEQAQMALKQGLDEALSAAVTSQIPEGFMLVSLAHSVTYSDIAQSPGPNDTALLSQSATAVVAIVRINDLAASLARAGAPEYTGEAVTIKNVGDITLSTASTTRPIGTLSLVVGGAPTVVWTYDPIALKQALLGKEKGSFESVLESFRPAIVRAEAKVRPFWHRTFPADPEKITVTTGEAN